MPLVDRLERKFRRWAIPNLTLILIGGQAMLYALQLWPNGIAVDRLFLDPAKVLQGEVWRLVTFPFTPPTLTPVGVIFIIFYFLLFHLFGTALETHWGAFRYNLFLAVGYVANVAAAFIAYGALTATQGADAQEAAGGGASVVATNGFLYGSIFLAFARLYPDFTMMLFFVLPVKIKYLALLQWAFFFLTLVTGDWMSRMLVVASTFNYLLFFGGDHWRQARANRRRQQFQIKAKTALKPPTHVCRVCGANSADSPRMLFRYCTKCEGQACYCPDHIQNHEHVAAAANASAADGGR